MFCSKCGSKLFPNAIYCHKCGNKITYSTSKSTDSSYKDISIKDILISSINLIKNNKIFSILISFFILAINIIFNIIPKGFLLNILLISIFDYILIQMLFNTILNNKTKFAFIKLSFNSYFRKFVLLDLITYLPLIILTLFYSYSYNYTFYFIFYLLLFLFLFLVLQFAKLNFIFANTNILESINSSILIVKKNIVITSIWVLSQLVIITIISIIYLLILNYTCSFKFFFNTNIYNTILSIILSTFSFLEVYFLIGTIYLYLKINKKN